MTNILYTARIDAMIFFNCVHEANKLQTFFCAPPRKRGGPMKCCVFLAFNSVAPAGHELVKGPKDYIFL